MGRVCYLLLSVKQETHKSAVRESLTLFIKYRMLREGETSTRDKPPFFNQLCPTRGGIVDRNIYS
jgi:hypothetical protein